MTLVVTACATKKTVSTTPINNLYSWNPVYGVASSIHFDSDSTFKFEWVTGLIRGGSCGIWYQYNDTIVLNSNKQPLQPIYLNQERRDQQYVSLKIRNYGDSSVIPFLRSKAVSGDTIIGGYTNELGELTFNLPRCDTIKLNSLEFGNQVIVCSSEVNHFDIWLVEKPLNDDYEPYTFFTNSIWMMKEKSIFDDSLQREFELIKRKRR